MNPAQQNQVGKTALKITQFGVGGTGFGNIYKAVGDQDALDTIDAAWNAGIRYFDMGQMENIGHLIYVHSSRTCSSIGRNSVEIAFIHSQLLKSRNAIAKTKRSVALSASNNHQLTIVQCI